MSDASKSDRPLEPTVLRNAEGEPEGYPVPLAAGRLWTLYPLGSLCEEPSIAAIQDELYEALSYRGTVSRETLYRAFEASIRLNYDLSSRDAAFLFWSVPPDHREPSPDGTCLNLSLAQAVIGAVLPSEASADLTYSDWLYSSLTINGIAPESVPAERLPAVLAHLMATGRIIPPERFVSSAVAGAERAAARAVAGR